MTPAVVAPRKKACPYCQKRLQAKSKGQWRNNLARHLANTCQPYQLYQRENLSRMSLLVCQLLEAFLPAGMTRPSVSSVPDYLNALKARSEISELERIAKL